MVSASEGARFFSLFAEHSSKLDVALEERKNLDEARTLIQDLQTMVSSHAAFLPGRDLQTYRERIEGYRKKLDQLKEPKKKFAFSRATKTAHAEKVQERGDKAEVPLSKAAGDQGLAVASATFTVADKLAEDFQLADAHGDVEIRNVAKCRITIRGCPNTLYIRDVTDTEVVCDPVASSVLIVGFRGSSLQVACQQLRIHKATGATFRLHITSRSIIEECRDLGFGPLPPDYGASEESWAKSGLNRETNNFTAVDDFDWLNTSQPSPNWKLIED